MIDVNHEIASVDRRVGNRTLAAGEARTVTISRIYDTPQDDLWDACTNPERIARWFLPISGDLRVGGRYALQGNASGTIERCEPLHTVDATWEFGEETSWIELRLTPEDDDRARLTLTHVAHVSDERWTEFGPGAVGIGWDLVGVALKLVLAGEEHDDVEAWSQSDEARQLIRRASERWSEASIAAGTEAAQAQAAADRTTAFYTGEPG